MKEEHLGAPWELLSLHSLFCKMRAQITPQQATAKEECIENLAQFLEYLNYLINLREGRKGERAPACPPPRWVTLPRSYRTTAGFLLEPEWDKMREKWGVATI